MNMKILNFGSCNIDFVYTLDHVAGVGETLTTHKLETYPGGKGLNQSIAMARAGAKVYHAGCIGENGGILTEILADNGVCTSFVRHIKEKNGHAVIQVSREGENSIFVYQGSNGMITKEYIDEVLNHFSKGDFIVLQNEINNIDYLIKKAKQKQMQIFLNPSPYNDKIAEIYLNSVSSLILNHAEAKALSGLSEVEEILQYFLTQYPHLKVMLTLGKNGCVYQDKNQKISHPVFKVDTVDKTATGDTFTGYFIASMAAETDCREIIKIASCAAAIAIGRSGPVSSIPYMKEVLEQMDLLPVDDLDIRSDKIRKRILQYIDENIKTASLKELAEMLGFSSTYAGNLVKRVTDKTFRNLLHDKRLHMAKKLLLETELSISDVIEAVGYENGSFFRKIFREKYGKNPLSYRKKVSK